MVYSLIFLAVLGSAITVPLTKEIPYDVIIIGAGIAGIGASKKLTDQGISHVILEARDRIGGRIYSQTFEGIQLDLGANYIHSQSNDALSILMKDMSWKVNAVETPSQIFLYQQQGKLDPRVATKAGEVHQKLMQRVVHNAFSSDKDLSVQAASQNFIDVVVQSQPEQVRNTVKWLSQIQGNTEGADLSQLSARQLDISDGGKDFIPQKGLSQFIQGVIQESSATVRLGQTVTQIDYRKDRIRVITEKNKVYKSLKVICSVPLGVLKGGSIKFQPQLPDYYQKTIDKLGVGNMNKLYVSFEQNFWGPKVGWLNFVTKNTATNQFPIASVVPSPDKNILCFFLSGSSINQLRKLSNDQIASQIASSMQKFFKNKKISVRNLKITSWDTDQFSMGSYSFSKVGTTMEDIIQLRQPIDNKLWFIGEHTHPRYASMVHGAYQTGQWAAEEIANQLNKQQVTADLAATDQGI